VTNEDPSPVTAAEPSASLGPIKLQPDISQLNTLALVYWNFITIGALVFVSIGQISCLLTSQALIGHEAPAQKRGAVIGAFSLCGAIGIMAFAAAGGRFFDSISPAAPFMLVGAGTAAVMLVAIVVSLKSPGRMPLRNKLWLK
jgi:MFS family permease